MASYRYSTKIGEYDDDVRVDIELTVKGVALDGDDYLKLNEAFDTIEAIALKYRDEPDRGEVNGTETST